VSTPQVIFRVDASLVIGTGHVMRCLTLAEYMRKRGAECFFLCREHRGHLSGLIEEKGFRVARLPVLTRARVGRDSAGDDTVDWQQDAADSRAALARLGPGPRLLVVDHYGLDARWERKLRPIVRRIFVMDDLADRCHDCDVLLDSNLRDAPESRYVGLVGPSTRVFVGPRYALLRPEFDAVEARPRDNGLQRMMIFMGGVDPSGEALKLVHALRALRADAPPTTLILGRGHPNASQVRQGAEGLSHLSILDATSEMARVMSEADLGIGTCGGAAWERCVVGLPSLVVVNADNQRDDARLLHELGAARNLGEAMSVTSEHWVREILRLRNSPATLSKMSRAAAEVMRGRREVMGDLAAALVG
jgi:UDP-2,4-diacetamido-2,4,6-trideoxy-beta-L-altropyranose hydrolase